MKHEYKYKIMLADDGGMTISDEGRTVYTTDSDMAQEMGEWILAVIKGDCADDAEVTVTINTKEDNEDTIHA